MERRRDLFRSRMYATCQRMRNVVCLFTNRGLRSRQHSSYSVEATLLFCARIK